jgi:branched-chain amino acid transport system substrate-binding protein
MSMKRMAVVALVSLLGTAIGLVSPVLAQQKAPYVIGVVLDMTGRQSNLGVGCKRGLDIAVDEVNKAGGVNGRQLQIVLLDGESDPAKAVIHTKRLIEVEKAAVLTGYTASSSTMASIQTAEGGKVPLVSSSPIVAEGAAVKKWIFTVTPRQKEASLPTLLEAMTQRGAKKIAYLYIDNVFGQNGLAVMEDAVKGTNTTLAVVEKYAVGATDLGPQITHIKVAGADGLIITGNVPDTTMAIKNARELGFAAPIFSDYAVVSPEFVELAGKYGEGIVSTSLKTLVAPDLPPNDPQKKVCMDLYNKYTKLYGAFSLNAGHTWDQIHMITDTLKKIDAKLDPSKPEDLAKIREQFRDKYETIKGFVGQNGIFNISPTNHNGLPYKCYATVVIEQGKWRLYKGK